MPTVITEHGVTVTTGRVGDPCKVQFSWNCVDDEERQLELTVETLLDDECITVDVLAVKGDSYAVDDFKQAAIDDGFADYSDPSKSWSNVSIALLDMARLVIKSLSLSDAYETRGLLLVKVTRGNRSTVTTPRAAEALGLFGGLAAHTDTAGD